MNYLLMHIYIDYCDNLLECPIESEGQMELLWGAVYNSKVSTGGTNNVNHMPVSVIVCVP